MVAGGASRCITQLYSKDARRRIHADHISSSAIFDSMPSNWTRQARATELTVSPVASETRCTWKTGMEPLTPDWLALVEYGRERWKTHGSFGPARIRRSRSARAPQASPHAPEEPLIGCTTGHKAGLLSNDPQRRGERSRGRPWPPERISPQHTFLKPGLKVYGPARRGSG